MDGRTDGRTHTHPWSVVQIHLRRNKKGEKKTEKPIKTIAKGESKNNTTVNLAKNCGVINYGRNSNKKLALHGGSSSDTLSLAH